METMQRKTLTGKRSLENAHWKRSLAVEDDPHGTLG